MDLRRDFSLQRVAMISWTASFWNRSVIQDKICDIFYEKNLKKFAVKKAIMNIFGMAKEELNAMKLPSVIYDQFLQIVFSLGFRVFNWYEKTSRKVLSIPCCRTREFHWTVFGTIDEAKTVEKNWIELVDTLPNKEKVCDILYAVCTSVLKDYIVDNAKKMLLFCERHEREPNMRDKLIFVVRSVLTLWNPERLSQKKKNQLMNKYFSDLEGSKEAYMFSLSVNKGHFTAAQYYWQQLSPLEKEEKVVTATEFCISECLYSGRFTPVYDLNSYTDILVFLVAEMSERQREDFFTDKLSDIRWVWLLNELIRSCAWEDYFFKLFDPIKELVKDTKLYCFNLLEGIIHTYYKWRTLGLDLRTTMFDRMFSLIWPYLSWMEHTSYYLSKIFKIFNFDIINAFLEISHEPRKQFILFGENKYKKLINETQFEVLEGFMKNVLSSKEERVWFNDHIATNYFDYFIGKGKLNVADNLLKWMANSDEERKRVKYKIDFLSLCFKYFIRDDCNYATKILSWGFLNEEEKTEYISHIEGSGVVFLRTVWCHDKDNFITKLSQFLKWFFNSESEDVNYKIGKILTEDVLRNFFFLLPKFDSSGTLNGCFLVANELKTISKLMELCLNVEDITKVKVEIHKNVSKWLLHFTDYPECCWGNLDIYLNFASGYDYDFSDGEETILDEERKRENVKNFLLSVDGIKFLNKFLKNYCHTEMKKYLGLWINWAGGADKIRTFVDKLNIPLSDDANENYDDLKNNLENFKDDSPSKVVKHHCKSSSLVDDWDTWSSSSDAYSPSPPASPSSPSSLSSLPLSYYDYDSS